MAYVPASQYVDTPGDTMTGILTTIGLVAKQAAATTYVEVGTGTANSAGIALTNASSSYRWGLTKSGASENFTIDAYSDAGTLQYTALSITRSTGLATLVGNPTAALGIATKQYVDAVIPAFSYKAPCRVVATTNITLSGTQTIDGVALAVDNRVLLTAQTTTSENGIWLVKSSTWVRPDDANVNGSIADGSVTIVYDGTVYGDSRWMCTATGATPWVPGSSSSTWARATPRISVQSSQPSNPATNDIWIDTT